MGKVSPEKHKHFKPMCLDLPQGRNVSTGCQWSYKYSGNNPRADIFGLSFRGVYDSLSARPGGEREGGVLYTGKTGLGGQGGVEARGPRKLQHCPCFHERKLNRV